MKIDLLTVVMYVLYQVSRFAPPAISFLLVANQQMHAGRKFLMWVLLAVLIRVATWAAYQVTCIVADKIEAAFGEQN